MMAYETLEWRVDDDGVALLTLNRPEQLNAFDLKMCEELLRVFRHDAYDDAVRAVVVTGAGKAFCAGLDLAGVEHVDDVFDLDATLEPTPEQFYASYDQPPFEDGVRDLGGKLTLAIHALPKPVIAAINGSAVGIGATMTLAMDIRLVSNTARLGFVFGRLGIVPEACSSWFLPRIVGMQQALEWVYSANILAPDEMLQGRLVRSVHEPEQLVSAALELARSFVKGRSPMALGLAKQLLYRNSAAPGPLEAHLSDSLAMFHVGRWDGKEGVTAFLEKRSPEFTAQASQIPQVFLE